MEIIFNFFYMNGYGLYIWPSYLFTFLTISFLIVNVISRKKKIEQKLAKFYKRKYSADK